MKNKILDLNVPAKCRAGLKALEAQESTNFVDICLNQPFGKLRVIGANFVEFTIEGDDCDTHSF